ncbi:MAG: spondin domain-containing protein [Pirellulaceae bacterium]
MSKMKTIYATARIILLIALIVLSAEAQTTVARYRLTFDATWSSATHPLSFPGNPHFSGLIGGTHSPDVQFWGPNQIATDGIESMAETGGRTALSAEIASAIEAGTAGSILLGGGIGLSPNATALDFYVTDSFPLVTMVSMIAPSPDWFVGVHGLALHDGQNWLEEVAVELQPYDAGTDSGPEYTSSNDDTNPAEPIRRLTTGPFAGEVPLGTFRFEQLVLGDFDQDQQVTAADIDLLSAQIMAGTNDDQFDLSQDGAIDQDDRLIWIQQAAATSVGDSNLDGRFDSSDLVNVFQFGQYEDMFESNSTWSSGDWTGDAEFDSADLVFAFQNGGFEQTANIAVQTVPEPNQVGAGFFTSGLIALRSLSRRRKNGKRRSLN